MHCSLQKDWQHIVRNSLIVVGVAGDDMVSQDFKALRVSRNVVACKVYYKYHFLVDGKLSSVGTGVFLSGRGANPTSRVVAVRF